MKCTYSLSDKVGGLGHGADNRIDVYIGRLRAKIEVDPLDPLYIQTIRGMGYVFRDRWHAA